MAIPVCARGVDSIMPSISNNAINTAIAEMQEAVTSAIAAMKEEVTSAIAGMREEVTSALEGIQDGIVSQEIQQEGLEGKIAGVEARMKETLDRLPKPRGVKRKLAATSDSDSDEGEPQPRSVKIVCWIYHHLKKFCSDGIDSDLNADTGWLCPLARDDVLEVVCGDHGPQIYASQQTARPQLRPQPPHLPPFSPKPSCLEGAQWLR